jgi:hypothetical protein
VQSQILRRNPDADLRVYVVWLPVMPLDARFDVADLLVDGRATHFWDNGQLVSEALGTAYGSPGRLVWDAFFVFGPDASWEAGPPRPLGSGSPVVDHLVTLRSLLDPYLT